MGVGLVGGPWCSQSEALPRHTVHVLMAYPGLVTSGNITFVAVMWSCIYIIILLYSGIAIAWDYRTLACFKNKLADYYASESSRFLENTRA